MSKRSKADLVAEVMSAVRRMQTDQDLFDELAAARLGVNRTDLRVLDVLTRDGPLTAGELAEASGLSRPALTAAVDRLQEVGYARRLRSETDRRQVRIEATPKVLGRAEEIWGPMGQEAWRIVSRMTGAELETIIAFMRRSEEISARHRRRLLEEAEAAEREGG
jgi:DNA-binding MarR family transcriptional regulator